MPEPIKFSIVEDSKEIDNIKYTKRGAWAQEVLSIAKAHPNQWLKLDEETNARYATTHLKKVGLKTRVRQINQATSMGTIYFMWEELI